MCIHALILLRLLRSQKQQVQNSIGGRAHWPPYLHSFLFVLWVLLQQNRPLPCNYILAFCSLIIIYSKIKSIYSKYSLHNPVHYYFSLEISPFSEILCLCLTQLSSASASCTHPRISLLFRYKTTSPIAHKLIEACLYNIFTYPLL